MACARAASFAANFSGERIFRAAPGPVSGGAGRHIHARVSGQRQQILHGNDADVGYGCFDGPDHGPDHIFARGSEVGFDGGLLGSGGFFVPPALRGVVVVGAGVDDGIFDVLVRQIVVSVATAESELEDAHSG